MKAMNELGQMEEKVLACFIQATKNMLFSSSHYRLINKNGEICPPGFISNQKEECVMPIPIPNRTHTSVPKPQKHMAGQNLAL